jgi:hypothetical protein
MHPPRRAVLAVAVLLAAGASRAPAQEPSLPAVPGDTLPASDPVRDFVTELADPVSLGVAGVLGLHDHVRTHPRAWGGGADALLQRVVSRAGGHVVGVSVRHGVASALGRSTRWEPCGCAPLGERVEHVFLETFTDLDRGGRRVLSEPYLAGTLAASLAPAAWHPEVSLRDGIASAGVSVILTLASRIVLELVPVP